ncbi:MAG: cupin domain-containing protein [Steroidobacteraceae bacterium]
MTAERKLKRTALAGAAVAVLCAGTLGLVHADQPAKAPYFSFHDQVPAIQETNIKDIRVIVTGNQSNGRQSILESYWEPAFKVPLHYHKKHAETFLIISGQVEWTINGETHVMGPGDAVHIPPNIVHGVRVVGNKDMHSIMIAEPGGYEEISAYDASFTAEQRKDPKLAAQLNALADFNLVNPPPPATDKK